MLIKVNKQTQLKKRYYKPNSRMKILKTIIFLIQMMKFITLQDRFTTSNTIQVLKIITKKELKKLKIKHKSC